MYIYEKHSYATLQILKRFKYFLKDVGLVLQLNETKKQEILGMMYFKIEFKRELCEVYNTAVSETNKIYHKIFRNINVTRILERFYPLVEINPGLGPHISKQVSRNQWIVLIHFITVKI